MKVLIITSEFPPEPQVQSRMVLDLARALAAAGHAVHVVCPFPSRPAGVQYGKDEISALSASVGEQGIVLTRVDSFITTDSKIWPRMHESWSFGRRAAAVIAQSADADVVYEVVWPMFAQAWVGLAARKLGIPQVSHVMDIYPESAYPKVPRWVRTCAWRPLLALDRANALRAQKLIVISESMRQVYQRSRRIPLAHMELVRTWQDESMFRELPERESAVQKYNLSLDCFTFLYLGNIGPVAGVDHLIRSFARAGLPDSQLLIVGEGTQKPTCMQLASHTRANVRFLSDPEVANVPLLHSLADVCLLPVRQRAAGSSFPSKLSGYMLSGKPVLASVDEQSDAACLIRKADCGWVLKAEDIEAMAGKMRELRSLDYRELAAAGDRGRAFAMEHLSKGKEVNRLASIILEAAREKPARFRFSSGGVNRGSRAVRFPSEIPQHAQANQLVHIAIINAVYPPEPVVSAQIGRDLAGRLVDSGTRVTVLCPYPSRPLGVEYPNFRPSATARVDREDGVEVVRLPSSCAPQSRLLGRLWESWSFGRHVCRYLEEQVGKIDVIYANTWPLFSQALIARYCARRSIPLVLHVQDIYPETLQTRLPPWLGGFVIPLLRAWDRRIAHRAAKVVLIGDGARSLYAQTRALPPERLEVIPNWQDESRFLDNPPRAQAAQHYAVDGAAFNFLYLGNIGPATDLELVIRAFAQASIANAQLLIVGDGSAKQACAALTHELGLMSVRFLSCPSPSDVPALQSLADVCLLPLKKGVALNGVPSKLAAYLFSGKPVLAALDAGSDTARCIREAQCGWVEEPENLPALVQRIREITASPRAELGRIGQRGRAYGLAHYSKAAGVSKLADIVLSVARSHKPVAPMQPSLSFGLEPLTPERVDSVVSLHLMAFPGFFLSFLGPRFLREFYVSFIMDPLAMAFVARDERDEVVGAVVGPLDPSGFFRRLLRRRWWAFCLPSLATTLSRPSSVPRLVRALAYRGDAPAGPVRALVSSLAVSPLAQGRGIGKALILRWVEEAARRGASGCYLTTDADNNKAVNRFYFSMGWKLESTYQTREGRKMNRYIYNIHR